MPSALPHAATQVQARRAVGFILMSALAPGSVQSFVGNQRVGRFALRVFGAVLGVIVLIVIGLLAFRSFTVGVLLPSTTYQEDPDQEDQEEPKGD